MLMTSEDCCDDAVLRYGKKDTHYAENLLAIAKLQRKGNDMKLLVQGIINKSSLANRIQKILDESLDRERASLGYLLSMAVFSFTLLVLFSNTKTMATEQSLESLDLREVQERLEEEIQLRKQSEQRIRDYEELLQQNLHELNERNIELRNKEATLKQKLEEKTRYKQSISESLPDKLAQREPPAKRKADIEMIPLFYVAPMYPTRAAREGIEGWVLLSFTVTALGNVSDIVVADSDPQDRFDWSAIRAAQKFSFAPRVENGIAVTVSDVQYLFNYKLQE